MILVMTVEGEGGSGCSAGVEDGRVIIYLFIFISESKKGH